MFMHKMFLILLCAFAAILSGCLGGTDKEIRYYTLPVLEDVKAAEAPQFPYTLTVLRASVDPAYRRNNIVYRESPYDFMYYTYSVWASRPEFLVEQVTHSYLKSKNLFTVLEYTDVKKPDFEFAVHVSSIEEVDKGEKRLAHLAVLFTLQKPDTEDFVWRKSYDKSMEYDSSDMRNYAAATAKLLEEFLADAVESIKTVVK